MDALVCRNRADRWNSEQRENILGIQNIFVLNFLKFRSILILVPTCTSCALSFAENTASNGLSHRRPDCDNRQLVVTTHWISCIIKIIEVDYKLCDYSLGHRAVEKREKCYHNRACSFFWSIEPSFAHCCSPLEGTEKPFLEFYFHPKTSSFFLRAEELILY